MSSFAPSLRSQTIDAKSVSKRGLSEDKLARRIKHRRSTLLIQFGSYLCSTFVISIYAYVGDVPAATPILYLMSGAIVTAGFFATSESGLNDRFDDHYLTIPQMSLNIAVQSVFLIALPQIGYVFLCVTFLTCSFAALRLTVRQSFIAWTFITLALMPVFVMNDLQIAMPSNTLAERVATFLLLSATIAQCVLIGLYGSTMRHQLYLGKKALTEAYERIEELAEIDELTGAFNRRSIMRRLEDEIARAVRLSQPCSIALMDLDWFKRINDTFGHPVGDEVLRTFSITIFANVREIDSFGRYGGEEFLMVLPGSSQTDAEQILNRLRTIVADLDWSALTPDMPLSISAGVATLLPSETSDTLLARADAALYSAKRNGRNRVVNAA